LLPTIHVVRGEVNSALAAKNYTMAGKVGNFSSYKCAPIGVETQTYLGKLVVYLENKLQDVSI